MERTKEQVIEEMKVKANKMVSDYIYTKRIPSVAVMDEEWRAELIEALKSGKYTAGLYKLKSKVANQIPAQKDNLTPCYCALGVLGDLAVDKNFGVAWNNDMLIYRDNLTTASTVQIPVNLWHFFGINEETMVSISALSDRWISMLYKNISEYQDVIKEIQFLPVINFLERSNVN